MELANQDPVNFKPGRKGDLVSVSVLQSQSKKKEAKPHTISASHPHPWGKVSEGWREECSGIISKTLWKPEEGIGTLS